MEDKRKNRFYEIRIFLRLCLALVFMLVLTGCEPRMMGTKSECSVHSVEGTSGANEFICRNSTDTYIYHKNAIYNYDTMEKLVDAEELTSMACNDDVLYYCIEMPSEVYCYDFSEEKSTLVKDKFASGMKANGDDVFIAFGYMTDEYVVNVEYYNKDKEGIFLNDWVEEHEPAEVNDIYEIYEFEGYRIVVDATKKLENKNIIYIENEDGFEFSCCGEYGRVCTDSDSCILSKINGEYLHLSKDVTFRYKGEKNSIFPILQEIGEEKTGYGIDSGLAASQIGVYEDKVYILAQYGDGYMGYAENPLKDFKRLDAFFELIPETGECKRLYKAKSREQIAGFSMKHNCLFLLRNKGVYRYDLETGKKKKVLKNKSYYELAFEFMDDTLYIFEVDKEQKVKFLKAVNMAEEETTKDKTEETTTEEWSINCLKEGVTSVIDTDTQYKAYISSKEEAEECIREYGKKQREKYSNPKVTEMELQMEQDYGIFAVNLGEMDIEAAKDVERAFSYMYEEYPILRGTLTNVTLGNFKSSEHGKIAVTQDKEFVINKDYGICPYVVKHEIILGAGSFMNRKNLLKTCEEMVDAGHWPEKMDISALVVHELGHQFLNVIAMQEFGLTTPYYITEDNQEAYSMYLTDELAANQTVPKKVLETAFAKWQENHEGDYKVFCAEISDYAIGKQPDGGISYPETFAEAITDVYLNGENAADASKVICEVAKEMGEFED